MHLSYLMTESQKQGETCLRDMKRVASPPPPRNEEELPRTPEEKKRYNRRQLAYTVLGFICLVFSILVMAVSLEVIANHFDPQSDGSKEVGAYGKPLVARP